MGIDIFRDGIRSFGNTAHAPIKSGLKYLGLLVGAAAIAAASTASAGCLTSSSTKCAATINSSWLVGQTSYTTLPFVSSVYQLSWGSSPSLSPANLFWQSGANFTNPTTKMANAKIASGALTTAQGIVPASGSQRWEDTYEASRPALEFPGEPSWIDEDRQQIINQPEFKAWAAWQKTHDNLFMVAADGGAVAQEFRSWKGQLGPYQPADADPGGRRAARHDQCHLWRLVRLSLGPDRGPVRRLRHPAVGLLGQPAVAAQLARGLQSRDHPGLLRDDPRDRSGFDDRPAGGLYQRQPDQRLERLSGARLCPILLRAVDPARLQYRADRPGDRPVRHVAQRAPFLRHRSDDHRSYCRLRELYLHLGRPDDAGRPQRRVDGLGYRRHGAGRGARAGSAQRRQSQRRRRQFLAGGR